MVEGAGDAEAVPNLVSRLLKESGGADALFVDPHPIQGAKVPTLIGRTGQPPMQWWHRQLGNAAKRRGLGAVLLITDGDAGRVAHPEYRKRFGTDAFCARNVAWWLAGAARQAGGGTRFSVGIVFAIPEYEAWLLASAHAFAGLQPTRSAQPIAAGLTAPQDPESGRDAKRRLTQLLGSYTERSDQVNLTQRPDRSAASASCRSFRRLERTVEQLIVAVRMDQHVVSPTAP